MKAKHFLSDWKSNEYLRYRLPHVMLIPPPGSSSAARLSRNRAPPFWATMLMFIPSLVCLAAAQDALRTGPETEQRFPPLKVPPQFKAKLFACDPLIEYPSVLALGPRSNSIFLAHDYMTGLGEKIVRRDEVRLVEDTDGDGYADTATVSRMNVAMFSVDWAGHRKNPPTACTAPMVWLWDTMAGFISRSEIEAV